jgi:hypothetical protein
MTRKLLILLGMLLVAALPAAAQDAGNEKPEKPDYSDTTYWNFGLYIAPNFDNASVSGNASNGISSDFLKDIEVPRMGYSLGAVVTRQVHKLLYIQTGFIYESLGYRTRTLQDSVLDLYDEFLYSREYHKAVRYNTFEIPVILQIKLAKSKKIQFNLGVGVAPTFCLNKTEISFFKDHKERKVSKAEKDFGLQALLNINMNVPLTSRLSLGVEPDFRYSLLGLKDAVNKGINHQLYSLGISLQLNYRITDRDFYNYYYLHIYKKPEKPNF